MRNRLSKNMMAGVASVLLLALAASTSRSQPPTLVKVQAVATKIDADGKQTVTVTLDVKKDWYLYANPVGNEELACHQTVLQVTSDVKLAALEVKYPAAKLYEDKNFRDFSFLYYDGKVSIQAIVQRAPGDVSPLKVDAVYVAASPIGLCQLPTRVKTILP